MSRCTSSKRLRRVACDCEFGGELQHCVARVSWSEHPDGRAHVTAVASTIDQMWAKGDGTEPANPADLGFVRNDRGVWRRPMDDITKSRLFGGAS